MTHDAWNGACTSARRHLAEPVEYSFTDCERAALGPFFSNLDRKVFFIDRMSPAVGSALMAMYSRLKNPRGLRGHFVDRLLPSMLAQFLSECGGMDGRTIQKWLKQRDIVRLDDFVGYSASATGLYCAFRDAMQGGVMWKSMAVGERIKQFLSMWLDAYGHNSIARTAQLMFGIEGISILAAKSLEWTRPGAGFIELSTRYVDFSGKAIYPVHEELDRYDEVAAASANAHVQRAIDRYRRLIGEGFDGPFPSFLRDRWSGVVPEADLKSGIIGESCDVLGNLLPCATLTQVGVSISGESLPELLKHLYLDDLPETVALAETIAGEAEHAGAGHFIRHLERSEWRQAGWSYLEPTPVPVISSSVLPREWTQGVLGQLFRETELFRGLSFDEVIAQLTALERGAHDKLPNQFEHVSSGFGYVMSFRGWRDLQRQGYCTHHRSLVTAREGFYAYPKPRPDALPRAFAEAETEDRAIEAVLHRADVPARLRQYAMAMGQLVTYRIGANLLQWEFCNWQRTKWGVNDEVRQQFLRFEGELRAMYPWWQRISRADMTPHYVFARGNTPVMLSE